MNEQNNNGQPNQPYQPYQGERAESVPPAQSVPPYQPYQKQQQVQPVQSQAQQPAQPYQPYQGQPQPYKMYQGPPVPPKKKSKWWIWLIVAGVVVLAVVALFLSGVIDVSSGVKRVGNQGAWEAYEYFDTMEEKVDRIMSASHKELADRLDTEPFEAEGDFEIKSDLIEDLGYGIDKLGADFKVKYDLNDLGIQLDLLSLVAADIYLIEDEWVISFMGEAYAAEIEIDTDVDLEQEMPLKDRMEALNTISSAGDFSDLLERLMAELAPAIPDELTETETRDVYSPLEDDKVEMKAITTTLEKDDLQDIMITFGENLEQNEELLDDLQDFLDAIAKTSGEDMDIDDIVEDMIEFDEDDMGEDFTFAWSVYEYKGETVGISFYIENDYEDEIEVFFVTEYTNNAIYTGITADYNGDEVIHVYCETEYADDDVDTDALVTISIPEDEYTDAQTISVSLKGTTTIEKEDSTEYEFSGDYKIKLDAGESTVDMGFEGPMEFDFEFSGDCQFGDDLGTIEDDDDWNEIYDQDWGDIEDLMRAIFNMSGTGDFGVGGLGDF